MNYKYIISLGVCIALCGCIGKQRCSAGDGVAVLDPGRIVSFELDDKTVPYSQEVQLLSIGDMDCLSVLNPVDNSIRIFNLSDGKEQESIDCSRLTGGQSVDGYSFIGGNLYLYNYGRKTLYKTDPSDMEQLYAFQFPSSARSCRPAATTGTPYPIMKVGNTVIMTGFIILEDGENPEERTTAILFDESSKNIEHAVKYPAAYDNGNWGGGYYFRMPFSDMDGNGNLVLSFGASDSLVVYNVDTKNKYSVVAKSDCIDAIRPYSRKKKGAPSKEEEKKWYMSVPSYEEVIYDKYEDCYYRVYRLPDTGYDGRRWNKKKIGIITLDARFGKVSEHIVPEDIRLNTANFFVTKEGLFFQKIPESEDEMVFVCFDKQSLMK